ncbi:MAG: YggT family protein [Anaerolineales bacterium]|nr:YggT family protein [Anaerolineales bacterium]MCS7248950.1 YggT family protein [Anaerolineales bacterium]MDW8162763.1 YggT family protein [Anaerolineales bacterium]MDW8445863.1 YggT family protein [Anaerolineales bacterium]
MLFVASVLRTVLQVYTFVVILKVILSYFLSPYHPIREAIDRLVDPLLNPIRRVLPPVGMFDFSPLVLIILIQIVDSLLHQLILSFY